MNKHSAYYRTIKGQLTQIYYGQKVRSKENGYPPPEYTKDELREWLLGQTIYWDIYVAWIDSGYKSDLKPSIDRLDDYKGYSFSNIRITTWGINDQKGRDDRRNGINNKQIQHIHQFSKSEE